jgi:hypothetical protein
MTRTKAVLALVASLALATPALAGSDNYSVETKEWDRMSFPVEVTVHKTMSELRQAALQAGVPRDQLRETYAFSTISKNPLTPCHIHTVEQSQANTRLYIGHELLHCMYGRWHS